MCGRTGNPFDPSDRGAGWQWTFVVLAIGPFLGAWAMYALRRLPEANRLAGGRCLTI